MKKNVFICKAAIAPIATKCIVLQRNQFYQHKFTRKCLYIFNKGTANSKCVFSKDNNVFCNALPSSVYINNNLLGVLLFVFSFLFLL